MPQRYKYNWDERSSINQSKNYITSAFSFKLSYINDIMLKNTAKSEVNP